MVQLEIVENVFQIKESRKYFYLPIDKIGK